LDSVLFTVPSPRSGLFQQPARPGATRAEVQASMKTKGASEIMHPSSIVFLDTIPLLGSGKTDYVALAKGLRDSGA
jgi:acyl-[acyl-carrier-protein]-phospholipid O-acyltransferase / long-chain-fatty-acid--[acyl-carrier-protein] ligase